MSSVLTATPTELDIIAVRQGLSWAQSWSNGPVLCRLGNGTMSFVVVNERRFLASWSWPLPQAEGMRFFLIPPFVANTINNPAAYNATALQVMLRKNLVGMVISAGREEFRLQWRWDPSTFKAPKAFDQMLKPPTEEMRMSYVTVADAVHLAIANLGQMSMEDGMGFEDAVIQIDFAPGQFNIQGQTVNEGTSQRYYFDPRLVLRSLEVSRGEAVGFSIQPVGKERAILFFTTQREHWRMHCAVLSIQRTAGAKPSTTLQVRESSPMKSNGVWVLPKGSYEKIRRGRF